MLPEKDWPCGEDSAGMSVKMAMDRWTCGGPCHYISFFNIASSQLRKAQGTLSGRWRLTAVQTFLMSMSKQSAKST